MIQAMIMITKHTTKITDIVIFVSAPTIFWKTFVEFVSFLPSPKVIQFQTIGKFVFSFTQQHQSLHSFLSEVPCCSVDGAELL